MPDIHAILSASSAAKWLNCTPSARLEATLPDTAGESAAEGTLAHSIAELKVKLYFKKITKATYTRNYNKLKTNELYSVDIDRYTDEYLERIKTLALTFTHEPHIQVEVRSDYSHIVPGGFGTADCIMIGGEDIHIIDFKYGKTVFVSAEDNPQMKLYASGVIHRYAILYQIGTVHLHIIQPRMDNYSEYAMPISELYAWEEQIKPLGALADAGEGECKCGEWCDSHFCKARAICRAYMSRMDPILPAISKPPTELTDAEVGEYLTKAADIKKWYSLLEKYAMGALLEGKEVSGWKVVEGRSNRAFKNIDEAYTDLVQNGYPRELLYKNVPITLTACEKLLGKKDFEALCSGYIIKPPRKANISTKQ